MNDGLKGEENTALTFSARCPSQKVSKPAPNMGLGAIGIKTFHTSVRPVRSWLLPIALAAAPCPPSSSVSPPQSNMVTRRTCTAAGRCLNKGRAVATIKPSPRTKHAPDVAEWAIFKTHIPKQRSVHWARRCLERLGCVLSRTSLSTCQAVPKARTNAMAPSSFLLVVTPVFICKPETSYPRPKFGKYLIKRIELGNRTKPTREKSRLSAATGWISISGIKTIIRSPKDLIHRFRPHALKSDHRTLMRQ